MDSQDCDRPGAPPSGCRLQQRNRSRDPVGGKKPPHAASSPTHHRHDESGAGLQRARRDVRGGGDSWPQGDATRSRDRCCASNVKSHWRPAKRTPRWGLRRARRRRTPLRSSGSPVSSDARVAAWGRDTSPARVPAAAEANSGAGARDRLHDEHDQADEGRKDLKLAQTKVRNLHP